jgi:membrane protease subunit (stomatin/prohibitin family)
MYIVLDLFHILYRIYGMQINSIQFNSIQYGNNTKMLVKRRGKWLPLMKNTLPLISTGTM